MYVFKVCRCCDSIIGELEIEDTKVLTLDYSLDVIGNVAYTLCPRCLQELDISSRNYYQ